jgi:hypothetical protein
MQTGAGAHTLFGVKWQGHEADHAPLISAMGLYIQSPHTLLWHSA